jgi:hypothetical protein
MLPWTKIGKVLQQTMWRAKALRILDSIPRLIRSNNSAVANFKA